MRQSACAVSAPLPGCRCLFPGSRELRAVRSTEQTSSSPRHLGMLSFASPLSQAGTAPGLGLPAGQGAVLVFWGSAALQVLNRPKHSTRRQRGGRARSTRRFNKPQNDIVEETATCQAAGQRSASGKAGKSPRVSQGHRQDLQIYP